MNYEGHSKRLRILARQHAGTLAFWLSRRGSPLRHPEVLERPANREGVFTFDLADDGRE